ncbi:hypothetical protein GCM10009557_94760 [Virgisporangium ochraceum]
MTNSALWIPAFDELSDPAVVVRLAVEAEEAGWHGFFLWDRLGRPATVRRAADPWVTLTAVAAATERLRLGPMVTPLARRRPAKVARETVTLDHLSGGRLTLGVGLGSDTYGRELARTGEQTDARVRAAMLDEALDVLATAWSGEPVHHAGTHYTVDGLRFLPTPVQPRIPVWGAGYPGSTGPLRRASRLDGYFPIDLDHPDQLAELVATLSDLRGTATGPYDVAVALPPGTDPSGYLAAGATWWMPDLDPGTLSVDLVRGILRDGPVVSR